jgi:hypothetical protein
MTGFIGLFDCSRPQLPASHSNKSKSKVCCDRRSVGQSVLVSRTHLGPKTKGLLLSDRCGFVDVEHSLWWEDGSVVYNYCWPSPAQSFSNSSPPELMTIFYWLRFETPLTWRARSLYLYPPGVWWLSYTPGIGFPPLRFLQLAGLRLRY